MVSAQAHGELLARAPGRANLIGEHTDYNDGLVLPVALELATALHGTRGGRLVRLRSEAFSGVVEVEVQTGDGPADGWGRHATAVVRALVDGGHARQGIDAVVRSDVPTGTGLSSSAAFEVALALALLDEPIGAVELARLCQRAENEYVGVGSGIMDPLVIAAAEAGAALRIDCRSLETVAVPMPDAFAIVVVDSGQRRELAGGAYNDRRRECEDAARRLGVASLREVDEATLARTPLPEPLARRARHVVTENARVDAAVAALAAGDRSALRELFAASHASLSTDFDVSTPELDALVAVAGQVDGVVAARMTGAGFGGCTVNLVETERAEAVAEEIVRRYERATTRRARAWVSRAAAGALGPAGG